MQIVTVLEDAKVLIPNVEHKNFTEGKQTIIKGTEISGEPKNIEGLRRGEPFTYRLFKTNDNKLIYLKKVQPMNTPTEVTLGADSTGAVSPTKINLKQNTLARPTVLAAISGAVIGFGWAKYKKHDMKKAGMYALIGGIVGFAGGYIFEHRATITLSK